MQRNDVPRPLGPSRPERAAVLPFLAVLATLAVPFAAPLAAQDVGGIVVGSPAPPLQGIDLRGRELRVAPGGARPLLIEFWAAWCPHCERLEPRMKAAYAKYGRRVRFLNVAVNVNESLTRVARTAAARGLPYPVLYDASGAATRDYDVPATSFVVIADAGGRVVYTGQGEDQDLDAALGHMLATKPGGHP
jgi:thiol-disulfide isomerase/thioredoxin